MNEKTRAPHAWNGRSGSFLISPVIIAFRAVSVIAGSAVRKDS